jgi:DNA-binding FadR family transcriptional regulator
MTFSAIERESAVESCLKALRSAILSGELAPGERLPPERKLAETFGVNRVTVRSALQRLETEHLVSVRQGSGYRVRDYKSHGGPDLIGTLVDLARGPKARAGIVEDLLLVRRHLARAVVERLADNDDDAALDPVHDAVDELARLASADATPEELAAADLAVVRALVAATGSPVLQLCFNPVASVLSKLPALQRAMFREPTQNVESYRLVLGWLEKGRRDLVDAVMGELKRFDRATVAHLDMDKRRK